MKKKKPRENYEEWLVWGPSQSQGQWRRMGRKTGDIRERLQGRRLRFECSGCSATAVFGSEKGDGRRWTYRVGLCEMLGEEVLHRAHDRGW